MDDSEALNILEAGGFTWPRGVITPPPMIKYITRQEADAIDYLCDEWDFDYTGGPPCE
jgi:hypothetical protein